MNHARLEKQLRKHESYRKHPYRDTEGVLTSADMSPTLSLDHIADQAIRYPVLIRQDLLRDPSLGVLLSDLFNGVVGELRVGPVLSTLRFLQPGSIGMELVLALGHIFKILYPVVLSVPIFVVDLIFGRARSDKGCGHESRDEEFSSCVGPVFEQGYSARARRINKVFLDSSLFAPEPEKSSDSALIADLIQPLIALNGLPKFQPRLHS